MINLFSNIKMLERNEYDFFLDEVTGGSDLCKII